MCAAWHIHRLVLLSPPYQVGVRLQCVERGDRGVVEDAEATGDAVVEQAVVAGVVALYKLG